MVRRLDKIVDLFGNSNDQEFVADGDELTSTLIGRYAEFMVCAQITNAGYLVTHVDGVGFDLILTIEEGSFTVQVKSTSRIIDGKCQWRLVKHHGASNHGKKQRQQRRLSNKDADLLALFHHKTQTTIIMPMRTKMPTHVMLPISQVEQASVEDSLEASLSYLLKETDEN